MGDEKEQKGSEAAGTPETEAGPCLEATPDEDLDSIFALLRSATGNDFSTYKRNTVMRRIERRMTINDSWGLGKYRALLEQEPREAEALAREILIGVTRFFRDPEAFDVLRNQVIPRLFAARDPKDQVRIWHACCSTGEEAYSVAMLVREFLDREGLNARVQLFATDIDEAAVAQGKSGLYAADIGVDVGDERLRAFFTRNADHRQVVKELREMILFAGHNIIKDPPFSRLDLLVCRNFLIYLNPDMQKRLISLFHLALKPGGYLFLGASESTGAGADLFAPVDKKWKIFQRLENGRRTSTPFPFTTPVRRLTRSAIPLRQADADGPAPEAAADRLLVGRYAPPSLVVNENFEVLYHSSRTRPYLEDPVGAPTVDILKKAREELRPALRAAIYKAFAEWKQVEFRGIRITGDEGEETVSVTVEPLPAHPSYGKLALVVLEPTPTRSAIREPDERGVLPEDEGTRELLIRQLEEQLRVTHEQLQLTSEQLETANEGFMATNEELMSINEEFQSANEELQATNEELEASREELQALNEELATVNAELQEKVEELHQANDDMENLFSSSGIATIFLDRHLTIKRFSPAMAGILNLIPADLGRPFRNLSGVIDWQGISRDAGKVLETQAALEREVTSRDDGRWFSMRVLPYHTTDGKIDGIVITLVDITDLRRAEEEVHSAALFPLENPQPVLRVGRDGTILFANRSSEPLLSLWHSDSGSVLPTPHRLVEEALTDGVPREYDIDIDERCISFSVVPFPERDYANLYGRDITKRKRAEEAAQRAREEWERTFDSVPDLISILDNDHRVLRVNDAMARRLGYRPEECVGRNCYEIIHGTSVPPEFCPHSRTLENGREHVEELHADSLGGDFLVTTTPLLDEAGARIGSVHIARDITERKRTEKEILCQLAELERFNRATVGRELRMVELKKEVNELLGRLGEAPRYPLDYLEE